MSSAETGVETSAFVPGAAPYKSRIESVGRALPHRRVTSQELAERARSPLAAHLQKLTGIEERRFCSDGMDAYSLALGAGMDCLRYSKHSAEDLELVIHCSISRFDSDLGYQLEPAMSLAVKEALGAGNAWNFDISNACAGMLTGVAILDDFIRRGEVKRGMVVSGEYISSLAEAATRTRKIGPQFASLTVGDAGAAVILEQAGPGAPGVEAWDLQTCAEHVELCIGRGASDAPGGVMKTDALTLQSAAIEGASPMMGRVFDALGYQLDEIDHLIPHQTSDRAIEAGSEVLCAQYGWPKNVVKTLKHYGNTASTTHFLALHDLLEEGGAREGDRVGLLCFASGIVVGLLVFTVDQLAEAYGRDR